MKVKVDGNIVPLAIVGITAGIAWIVSYIDSNKKKKIKAENKEKLDSLDTNTDIANIAYNNANISEPENRQNAYIILNHYATVMNLNLCDNEFFDKAYNDYMTFKNNLEHLPDDMVDIYIEGEKDKIDQERADNEKNEKTKHEEKIKFDDNAATTQRLERVCDSFDRAVRVFSSKPTSFLDLFI